MPELLRLEVIAVKPFLDLFDPGQIQGASFAVPGDSQRTMPP
jgi:hypothetical protein